MGGNLQNKHTQKFCFFQPYPHLLTSISVSAFRKLNQTLLGGPVSKVSLN